MKTSLILFSLNMILGPAFADFPASAQKYSQALKQELLAKVSGEIKKNGVIKAVEFCHENALSITRQAQGEGLILGRTSDKLRNPQNAAAEWMKSYLQQAALTTAASPFADQVVVLKTGKSYYLSALYVGTPCLNCHGSPQGELKQKLQELYPKDMATGYKLGDFRGFVWVAKPD